MKVKAIELEPGMVLEGGIGGAFFLVEVGIDHKDDFWDGPYIRMLDVHDSYHGSVGRSLDMEEEFEVFEGDKRAKVLEEIHRQLIDAKSHLDDCTAMIRIARFGDKQK